MLFNSLEFLLFFLPIVLIVGLRLRKHYLTIWIAFVSTIFYMFAGHAWFILPMYFSALLDFWAGSQIEQCESKKSKKFYLYVSVIGNLGLLAYFKYFGFFLDTIQSILISMGFVESQSIWLPALRVILPAGISFYTFQTLSYIIDIYRGTAKPEKSFWTYFSFVSFFPHLVAGPLTRHNQLIPQIKKIAIYGFKPQWKAGLFLFIVGLSKKVLIADRIGSEIDPLILNIGTIGPFEAWFALLGYTLQIYFDFSGYSDMAIGLGRLMQIELPINFNSPYKAKSPSDFWRRWHISLSLWLRDYLYISLGGNRSTAFRQKINLFITMLLGGLWHGASWNFAIWGAYHGLLLLLYHHFKIQWDAMNQTLQRVLTFFLIAIGWVFFRSPDISSTKLWLEELFFIDEIKTSTFYPSPLLVGLVAFGLFIAMKFKNSNERDWNNLPTTACFILGVVGAACILLMNYSSKFLYFQF